jgi:hypothetical protein
MSDIAKSGLQVYGRPMPASRASRAKAVDIILVGGREVGSPVDIYDLQCVALTTAKKRCQRPVEWSQHAMWDELTRYDVDGASGDEQLRACFQRQRCTLHAFSDVPDAVPMELFDLGPAR